jgi:hypothetical protein
MRLADEETSHAIPSALHRGRQLSQAPRGLLYPIFVAIVNSDATAFKRRAFEGRASSSKGVSIVRPAPSWFEGRTRTRGASFDQSFTTRFSVLELSFVRRYTIVWAGPRLSLTHVERSGVTTSDAHSKQSSSVFVVRANHMVIWESERDSFRASYSVEAERSLGTIEGNNGVDLLLHTVSMNRRQC